MRVLLCSEIGLNLGHLSRLQAIATRLVSDGHTVLAAVNQVAQAEKVLGGSGIGYVQAPKLQRVVPSKEPITSYAELLLLNGWLEPVDLAGLTHAWNSLFSLFGPDRVVLDYSPSAHLAARFARLPVVLVGNGFEIPPVATPLPPFPFFDAGIEARSRAANTRVVATAQAVAKRRGHVAPIPSLSDIFGAAERVLTTIPELDHYGAATRQLERYAGPLLTSFSQPPAEWPPGDGPKIFAALRGDTANLANILAALEKLTEARILCVALNVATDKLPASPPAHLKIVRSTVALESVLDADLCVSYGAEGTNWRFLLAGVPVAVSPGSAESMIAIRRAAEAGIGRELPNTAGIEELAALISTGATDQALHEGAAAFARNFAARGYQPLDTIAAAIVGSQDRPG